LDEQRLEKSPFLDEKSLENRSPSELLHLDAKVWEVFMQKFPNEFLQKLEIALNLKDLLEDTTGSMPSNPGNFQLNPIIFEIAEEIPISAIDLQKHRKIPIFEVLCKLYYTINPQALPNFVNLVGFGFEKWKNTQMMASSSSKVPQNFFKRAIQALPPLSSCVSDEQIMSRFSLLCSVGSLTDAMRLLLEYDRWEQAREFARNKMDHDVDHFVLFQLLLNFCLKVKSLEKLQQIWEIMPNGFGIFDLLSIVKHYLLADPTNRSSPNVASAGIVQKRVLEEKEDEMFVVEAFRPQLLQMWNARSERNI